MEYKVLLTGIVYLDGGEWRDFDYIALLPADMVPGGLLTPDVIQVIREAAMKKTGGVKVTIKNVVPLPIQMEPS